MLYNHTDRKDADELEIGKPIAVEHVFKMKFDPATGKMQGGQNVPEEFRKLFADILGDSSSVSSNESDP
jgi:hypothetical protein